MVGATFFGTFLQHVGFFHSFYDGFDMFYMSRAASSFRNVQRCREGNSGWDAMLNLVALNYFDFDRFGLLLSTANAHLNIGVLSLLFPMFRWREKAARMSKDRESWFSDAWAPCDSSFRKTKMFQWNLTKKKKTKRTVSDRRREQMLCRV